MSVEVIVLLKETDELVPIDGSPWHEFDLRRIDHQRWANLAIEIARRAAARKPFQVDLYLHFKGDHLVGKYDYDFVEKLIELAREHTWGAKVFIVLDQGILKQPDEIKEYLPLVAYWLETVQRGRVADLVLTNLSRANPESSPPSVLKKGGSECRAQYDNLPWLLAPGIWRCWPASRSAMDRLRFDIDLVTHRQESDNNLLIVVDRKSTFTSGEINEIKRLVRKNRSGRLALGVVGIAASAIHPDLLDLADQLSLRLIQFRGWLDLRFFLVRLNSLWPTQVLSFPEAIDAAPVEPVSQFTNSRKSPGHLLVTNGFNHQQDISLCREAARDVGKLLHVICQRAEYLVHPSVRSSELSGLFSSVKQLTAWWFIGHGSGLRGLQDVDGQMLRPQEWLGKIPPSVRRLPLAFFSACHSAETAHAFARAGVGVAIGFDSDTLPSPCRLLAIMVIEAALNSRGNPEVIMGAFTAGCRQLQARGLAHVRPKAFYAVH